MLDELARRAVACPDWRWMPGMAYLRRGRSHRVDPDVLSAGGSYDDTCLPDLTDPATLGCFLALVREVCGKQTWVQCEDEWVCWVISEGCIIPYSGKTEAEALVYALEAGP